MAEMPDPPVDAIATIVLSLMPGGRIQASSSSDDLLQLMGMLEMGKCAFQASFMQAASQAAAAAPGIVVPNGGARVPRNLFGGGRGPH